MARAEGPGQGKTTQPGEKGLTQNNIQGGAKQPGKLLFVQKDKKEIDRRGAGTSPPVHTRAQKTSVPSSLPSLREARIFHLPRKAKKKCPAVKPSCLHPPSPYRGRVGSGRRCWGGGNQAESRDWEPGGMEGKPADGGQVRAQRCSGAGLRGG